jgi:peptidylprolyl isomerase
VNKPQSSGRTAAPLAKPRRRGVTIVVLVVVVLLVLGSMVGFLISDSGSGSSAGSTSTTGASGATAATSVAGKPCVAQKGQLPPGAPAVPVQVGPPPTNLVTRDLEPGTGATVNPNATVTVDYIGVACSTGEIFDSSYSRQQAAVFNLAQVIPGFQAGIAGMKVGGTRLLAIPPAQAYGSQGRPPVIAPGETLWFVIKVENAQ